MDHRRETQHVLIHGTFLRVLASWMPRQQDVVVLPTPPFPPTNTHCRDCWSMMFFNDGSGRSKSSKSLMVKTFGRRCRPHFILLSTHFEKAVGLPCVVVLIGYVVRRGSREKTRRKKKAHCRKEKKLWDTTTPNSFTINSSIHLSICTTVHIYIYIWISTQINTVLTWHKKHIQYCIPCMEFFWKSLITLSFQWTVRTVVHCYYVVLVVHCKKVFLAIFQHCALYW